MRLRIGLFILFAGLLHNVSHADYFYYVPMFTTKLNVIDLDTFKVVKQIQLPDRVKHFNNTIRVGPDYYCIVSGRERCAKVTKSELGKQWVVILDNKTHEILRDIDYGQANKAFAEQVGKKILVAHEYVNEYGGDLRSTFELYDSSSWKVEVTHKFEGQAIKRFRRIGNRFSLLLREQPHSGTAWMEGTGAYKHLIIDKAGKIVSQNTYTTKPAAYMNTLYRDFALKNSTLCEDIQFDASSCEKLILDSNYHYIDSHFYLDGKGRASVAHMVKTSEHWGDYLVWFYDVRNGKKTQAINVSKDYEIDSIASVQLFKSSSYIVFGLRHGGMKTTKLVLHLKTGHIAILGGKHEIGCYGEKYGGLACIQGGFFHDDILILKYFVSCEIYEEEPKEQPKCIHEKHFVTFYDFQKKTLRSRRVPENFLGELCEEADWKYETARRSYDITQRLLIFSDPFQIQSLKALSAHVLKRNPKTLIDLYENNETPVWMREVLFIENKKPKPLGYLGYFEKYTEGDYLLTAFPEKPYVEMNVNQVKKRKSGVKN